MFHEQAVCKTGTKIEERITWWVKVVSSWGARGVMVIVVGSGHGDTSSNPGRDWLQYT